MWLMIKLKVTKNQGFTLSLEDTSLKKPQRKGRKGAGRQINTPSQIFLRVKVYLVDAYA